MHTKAYKYGIELEMVVDTDGYDEFREAVSDLDYDCKDDGSIRTGYNQYSLEITSPPLSYRGLRDSLTPIERAVERYGAGVNQSCGFHLHVSNKRFFMRKYLERILRTWLAVEDVFYLTQPATRYRNHYCKRRMFQFLRDMGKIEIPRNSDQIRRAYCSVDRYMGLNLNALSRHGTLEIRLHSATLNKQKIMAWVDLMSSFFNYCLNHYDKKQVEEMLTMPTSKDKAAKVWEMLGIPQGLQDFYNDRIVRVNPSTLQNSQKKALDFLPKAKHMQGMYNQLMKLQRSYQLLEREQHEVMREFDPDY